MENKTVNLLHNRINEVDDFIFMIEKYNKKEFSNENFLNKLAIISENNLKKYSEKEQEISKKNDFGI